MKRCPECRRDYYDDSLIYCLDDGVRLLEGPAPEGPATAVMPHRSSGEAATRTFENTADNTFPLAVAKRSRVPFVAIGAIALVIGAGLTWLAYTYRGRGSGRQIESIAVMPFVNAAGNPEIDYLSDGLTESLINSLSQVPTLAVKARSSVFAYKGKEVTPQQLAKELSVQAVLNGRVVQRGDQVVLNVELADATTGNQLWGEQYTRKMTDLVQLQSDIARDVSGRLREKLSGSEQQRVSRRYTENTEAYQLYLRGRHHWNKRNADDIRKSIEYFQQAIDKDPTYALAYGALAEAYILVPNYRMGRPDDYYPKARAAAQKAIEIDDTLAEPHVALASVVSNHEWNFVDAEAEFKKALSLNPNYATGHQWYSEFLLSVGRTSEALAEMKRAQELDPLSLIINGMLGVVLRMSGRNEEALEQLKKTIEIDPNFGRSYLYLSQVYQKMGRYEEAADAFGKFAILRGAPPELVAEQLAKVKMGARTGGAKGYSRAMAEVLESRSSISEPPPPIVIAGYWVHAGETEKAFALLEAAYRQHDDGLLMLKDDRLDPIKQDPRYKDLVRRVGLPE